MKQILIVIALLAAFVASPVFAHGSHGSIDAATAQKIAARTVQQMTFKDMGYAVGRLDASWKTLREESVLLEQDADGYFVVSVKNSETGEVIYMQIADTGEVVAVNEDAAF